MNGGSNTETKYHEEDCQYVYWLTMTQSLEDDNTDNEI